MKATTLLDQRCFIKVAASHGQVWYKLAGRPIVPLCEMQGIVFKYYWNVDLGITKIFQVTERVKIQLRAEGFNALNHPNFDHPVNASVGSPSILSTVFGQSCCATVAPPSTQTIIQTGESARIIQFALKLMF